MRLLIGSILIIASVVACNRLDPDPAADIVLINGEIYTVDADLSWAEAAAIRDGRIALVGDNESIERLIGAGTEVIDLKGRMAMPGLVDSHSHPLEGGYESVFCNLWEYDSIDDVVEALRECDKNSNPDDTWFQAVGLDLSLFGISGADNSILDGIADGKFVFIDMSDGHTALVNAKVLDLVGFDANTLDPPGGVIERREGNRKPNGTVRETARNAVDALLPRRDLATSTAAMASAVGKMNSVGITSVYDVWIGEHEMQVYQSLDKAGGLSVFVLGAIIDEGPFEKHTGSELKRIVADRHKFESDRISYDSVKFMVDGVFEGETAAVLDPYNTTGQLGVLNHAPDQLRERVAHYYDLGMQLHFHTMGDHAARSALDAIQYAREHGDPALLNTRHALSHLGLIDEAEYPRFKAQNAAAAFTAVWAYPNEWTINLEIPTLGQERVDKMYPIRSVHEAGGVIVGSSDWNYGELDPLLSIETAITRQDPFAPSELKEATREAVDLETMIAAYTINGAWLMHREHVTGSIEQGKLADIVIFDANLFDIDTEAISEVKVDVTIFAGEIVYRRNQDTGSFAASSTR